MQPIGPPMIEHRLIERVLDAIRRAAGLAAARGSLDPADRVFFPAAMRYFDEAQRHAMLDEMHEFDRRIFHERYAAAVKGLAERLGRPTA